MNFLPVTEINEKICQQHCAETSEKLSEKALKEKYEASPAVLKRINEIKEIMIDVGISERYIDLFIEKYKSKLIPAGTKGSICGKVFNDLVKEVVQNLPTDRYVVEFEKPVEGIETGERPDWYIQEKVTGKIIIGMNQMDLWGGGEQLNRGDKYILNNKINSENVKLLCVVCNKTKIYRKNTKIYKILNKGFQEDTLCYITNIQNIVNTFFL